MRDREGVTPQEAQLTKSILAETVEIPTQVLEDAQAAGKPVDTLAVAVANGEAN